MEAAARTSEERVVATDALNVVPRLTVVGSTMIDLVTYAERLPERGETVTGDRFEQGFGGKGANQAVISRLMGADVSMIGAVGDDDYGDQTCANLKRYGIDIANVRRVKGASGVAPIWVEPDGSNRIIIVAGANRELRPSDAAEAVKAQDRVDAVLGQLEIEQTVTAAAFEAARERGAVTILNPAPAASVSPCLAAVTDWIIPNETEIAYLVEDTGGDGEDDDAWARLADSLDVRMVVTLGRRGAAIVLRDGSTQMITTTTVVAKDTTGAGDAFVGAFAVGLASGWDEVEAVRVACRIATDSVLRRGTQSAFPDTERCSAIISERGVHKIGKHAS